MSEKKRTLLLLAVLGLLFIANVVTRLGDEGFDATAFFNQNMDGSLSPRQERLLAELEKTPQLTFRNQADRAPIDATKGRNPFIFGVDRRQEEQRRQQMEQLKQAREEAVREAQQKAVEVVEPEPAVRFSGRYIGMMSPSFRPTDGAKPNIMVSIFYEDQIHIMREGDELAGFQLLSIEPERLQLRHRPSGEQLEVAIETK